MDWFLKDREGNAVILHDQQTVHLERRFMQFDLSQEVAVLASDGWERAGGLYPNCGTSAAVRVWCQTGPRRSDTLVSIKGIEVESALVWCLLGTERKLLASFRSDLSAWVMCRDDSIWSGIAIEERRD